MVDPITGIGLASSIITIVEVGYKITRRTIEFSHLLGDLPPDLQSCKDLVDIVVRVGERLQRKMPPGTGEDAVQGPPTELQADLQMVFDQYNKTAISLFELIESLQGSGALSRAVRLARKEGKIAQIRNRLDQHVLAILFLLGEDQNEADAELRYHPTPFSLISLL